MPRGARSSNESSDERCRTFVEHMPVAVVVQDVDLDRFVEANGRAAELFRMSREQLLDRNLSRVTASSSSEGENHAEALRAWMDAALAGRPHVGAWACRNSFSIEIPCELRLVRLPSSTANLVCGIIVDSREGRDVQERLRRAREQLRALSSELQESVVMERARISRELHDQLGQLMTAAKLNVAMIVRSIDKLPREHDLRGELLERTTIASDVIDQTLDRTRKMAAELRPEGLDTLGLAAMIESDLDVFASRTGIRVGANLDPRAGSLPRKVSAVLLRCMQELLTNVARHAQASRVDVRLECRDGFVLFEVRDDGIGMDEDARGTSLGIVGLEERVSELEGTVRFESGRRGATARGTAAIIEIPFVRGAGHPNAPGPSPYR